MYVARDFWSPLECLKVCFFRDKALKKGSWKMPAQIRALGLSICTAAEVQRSQAYAFLQKMGHGVVSESFAHCLLDPWVSVFPP